MAEVIETLPEIKIGDVVIRVETVGDIDARPDNLGECCLCPEGAINRETGEILDKNGNPVQQYDELKTWVHAEYKYWKPANHWPHDPKNWSHVDQKTTVKVIEEYGSIRDADIAYAIQDFLRYTAWVREEWYLYGVQMSVMVGDRRVFQRAVFGLESDADLSHRDEVQADLLESIKLDLLANHKTKIEQMLNDLVVLEQAFQEPA